MTLVGNNSTTGVYLAVAASSNQLPQHFAFNDSAEPPPGDESNRDVFVMSVAKGHTTW
jgi:hypothetical protein